MNSKVIINLCTGVEILGVLGLTAMGLKRNNDCYKAEKKLAKTKMELLVSQMENVLKDAQIECLEKELNKLKKEQKGEES